MACKAFKRKKYRQGNGRAAVLLLSTSVFAIIGMTLHVVAQTAPTQQSGAPNGVRTFNIAAQPLRSGISQFNRQSGVQVSQASGSVSTAVRTNAVSGQFTPQEALRRMLSGTGVPYRFISSGSAVIGSVDSAGAAGGAQSFSGVTGEDVTILDPIVITADQGAASGAGFQGTPDWVYETPTAVSVISREAIQNAAGARDARDLLDNVAGAYVNNSSANSPAISPNIRGVQDMGRVVVSIDGARHNANRTMSPGGDEYIGSAGKAFVDPAFIRSVEVDRSTGSKAGLAGSLAGAVTFRTVSADDLIQSGQDWGLETNTTFGTNNQHLSGSVLGAARIANTPFSIVGGASRQDLGDYKTGKHGSVEWSGDDADETTRMGRDNWSSLLKLEGDFGDVRTGLAWTHQEKKFSWAQGVGNPVGSFERALIDTVTASLDWNPEDNDLIDLRTKFWLNSTRESTLRGARGNWPLNGYPDTQIDADYLSFGFNVDNTTRFDTKLGAVTLNYGVEAFRDIAKSSASSPAIDDWPELESNFTSFSPAGRRDVASAFVTGDWEVTEWATLSAGLRYDWYRLKGNPTYYDYESHLETTEIPCGPISNYYTAETYFNEVFLPENPSWASRYDRYLSRLWTSLSSGCMPGTGVTTTSRVDSYPATILDIDRSGGAWLPSASVEFKPVEWFRPYVSYSQSYRPPTTAEAFFTGDLPGATNPGYGFAPNELLESETAQTWEIGANISLDQVFTDRDSLRLKVSAFDRKIENYIVLGYFYTSATSRRYTGYVNTTDDTRMRGLEIEGNYDTGRFWFGGSATWLDSDWAQHVARNWYGHDTGSDRIRMYASSGIPPKFKGTIDARVRLFEERLAVGGRVTHSTPTLTQIETISVDGRYLTNEYTKLDLYGSYKFNDNVTLRVSVDNLTDVNHVPAGSRYPAPGRTFFANLQTRW